LLKRVSLRYKRLRLLLHRIRHDLSFRALEHLRLNLALLDNVPHECNAAAGTIRTRSLTTRCRKFFTTAQALEANHCLSFLR
jgi:hypothetical protein